MLPGGIALALRTGEGIKVLTGLSQGERGDSNLAGQCQFALAAKQILR